MDLTDFKDIVFICNLKIYSNSVVLFTRKIKVSWKFF